MNRKIEAALKQLFPKDKIKYLGEGDHSIACSIGDELVVKISKNKHGDLGLNKEFNVLKMLEGKTTTVTPKAIKIAGLNVDDCEYRYLICSKLKGKYLKPKEYRRLKEEKKDRIAKDVALFLTELHSVKCDIPYKIDRISELNEQLMLIRQKYFDMFDVEKQKEIEDFYKREIDFFTHNTTMKVLIHNDFSAGNILFDNNNNFCGVLDFADAAIGDRDNDFLYLLEESKEEFGLEFGKRVVKYYNHDNPNEVFTKAAKKETIWKFEELYWGDLYGDKKMINEALKEIKKKVN